MNGHLQHQAQQRTARQHRGTGSLEWMVFGGLAAAIAFICLGFLT